MKWNWKNTVVWAVAVVAFFAGRAIYDQVSANHASSSRTTTLEATLEQASASVNSRLPMQIDKDRRLDTTIAGPGKRLTYYYTLLSVNSVDVTQQQLRRSWGAAATKWACTSEGTRRSFINNGVQMVYDFRGEDGGEIGNIVVSPSDCEALTKDTD